MTPLEAWNIAVAAFKKNEPEKYKSLEDYLSLSPRILASSLEHKAFKVLWDHRIDLPIDIATGER